MYACLRVRTYVDTDVRACVDQWPAINELVSSNLKKGRKTSQVNERSKLNNYSEMHEKRGTDSSVYIRRKLLTEQIPIFTGTNLCVSSFRLILLINVKSEHTAIRMSSFLFIKSATR